MVQKTKNEMKSSQPGSKIRGRVFSPDTSGSKMAALLAEKGWQPTSLNRGESIEGTIVSVLADVVLIDIGAKAEGVLPKKELQEIGEKVEVGTKVLAVVAQAEGDSGSVVLTVKKTLKEKSWGALEELIDSGEVLDVKGVSSNRGGLIVEYKGVRGFIPSSHLVTGAKEAIGKNLSVKVIQVNKDLHKLVFSEKEVAGDTFSKIELPFKEGDTLKVKVSKVLPFGLLVSTQSGQEGLIHISEISWKKVSNLEDGFKLGQDLQAKVISIDPNGKVNLSIKQLEKDPWKEAAEKYKVGVVVERPVSRTTSYGVFVELEEGIEGLLHSSKIPYGVQLKEGDNLKVQIDLFSSEQRRVALRLAQEEVSKDNVKSKSEKEAKETKETKETKVNLPAGKAGRQKAKTKNVKKID